METVTLKLVTIVAEAVLEDRLVTEMQSLGATGFTVAEVRGEGTRHLHAGEIPGSNVRIESIVDGPVAERILEHVAQQYFAHYGVIAFVSDVAVIRRDKYAGPPR